jgi:hypothetical protein
MNEIEDEENDVKIDNVGIDLKKNKNVNMVTHSIGLWTIINQNQKLL